MKAVLLLIALFGYGTMQAQEELEAKWLVKGNALLIPGMILNVGSEYKVSMHSTLQADVLISPWKSISGNHAQVYMGHIEWRYYLTHAFDKWYIGLNTGLGLFDLTKWNYSGADKFQRGFTILAGATLGYQYQISSKWYMDLFVGGGTSQANYHGYELVPPDRWIRYDAASEWNKSGEIIPYRGGVMLSYKIR